MSHLRNSSPSISDSKLRFIFSSGSGIKTNGFAAEKAYFQFREDFLAFQVKQAWNGPSCSLAPRVAKVEGMTLPCLLLPKG